jgi:hypothetical protein
LSTPSGQIGAQASHPAKQGKLGMIGYGKSLTVGLGLLCREARKQPAPVHADKMLGFGYRGAVRHGNPGTTMVDLQRERSPA